jgi:hypothetical protein
MQQGLTTGADDVLARTPASFSMAAWVAEVGDNPLTGALTAGLGLVLAEREIAFIKASSNT